MSSPKYKNKKNKVVNLNKTIKISQNYFYFFWGLEKIILISALILLIIAGFTFIQIAPNRFKSSYIDMIMDFIIPFNYIIPLDHFNSVQKLAIKAGSVGIVLISWYFLTNSFKKIFQDISVGKVPFSNKHAKQFKRLSSLCFIIGILQPIFIFWSLIIYAFSFLFEYGNVLEENHKEMFEVQSDVIISFAEITEAKSGQTGQHIKRVSEYCRIFAEELGYSQQQIEKLRIASMMHDVGKIMIPAEILEKPGKLTLQEFEIIKKHTSYGEQLLHNAQGDLLELARKISYEHHERWDGNGYHGLKGDNICQEARIVSIADVFDALISKRSYKDEWDKTKVYHEILSQREKQFDPILVELFINNYDKFLYVANINHDSI